MAQHRSPAIILNARQNNYIICRHVEVIANASTNPDPVTVTAEVPSGYEFLMWIESITVDWVGVSKPASEYKTTDFYTSVGTGGDLYCYYLCKRID